MKYMLYVCLPSVTTLSIRVAWTPKQLAAVSGQSANTGDLYSETFTITGSQAIYFTVPYCSDVPWKLCGRILDVDASNDSDFVNGAMSITVLNVPTSATTDTTVRFSLFQTIGEDFQFQRPHVPRAEALKRTLVNNYSLRGVSKIVDPRSIVELEGRISERASVLLYGLGEFPSLGKGFFSRDEGVVMGSEFKDIKELMHRFVYHDKLTLGAADIYSDTDVSSVEPLQRLVGTATITSELAMIYLFLRGSVRFRIHGTGGSGILYSAEYDDHNDANMVIASAKTCPFGWNAALSADLSNGEAAVEIPWYCRWTHCVARHSASGVPVNRGYYYPQRRLRVVSATAGTINVFSAYGDDTSLGFLCAPPAVWANPPIATGLNPGIWPY